MAVSIRQMEAPTAGKSKKIPGTNRNSWLLAECWGRSKADKEWAGPEETTAGFGQSVGTKGNRPNGLEWWGGGQLACGRVSASSGSEVKKRAA